MARSRGHASALTRREKAAAPAAVGCETSAARVLSLSSLRPLKPTRSPSFPSWFAGASRAVKAETLREAANILRALLLRVEAGELAASASVRARL